MILETKQIEDATFYHVVNDIGFEATFSDFGAGIYALSWCGKPLTAGPKDPVTYLHHSAYYGKTIGRIAGRVGKGQLSFKGKTYALTTNEGQNTLHGGVRGFSYQHFEGETKEDENGMRILFTLHSPDGDQGFPGNVTVVVTYFIPKEEARLRISYHVESDRDTPISLTCHTYFNLGGEKTIEGHALKINAPEVLTYDADLIPDHYVSVPDYLDFRKEKVLGPILSLPALSVRGTTGIDHAFHRPEAKGEFVTLENGELSMHLHTSYDDVVVYTTNYPPFGLPLVNGRTLCLHGSVAIEPQYESLDFPRMTVRPNKPQENFIEYSFSVNRKHNHD